MKGFSQKSKVCRFAPNYAVCRKEPRRCPTSFGGGHSEKYHLRMVTRRVPTLPEKWSDCAAGGGP
jgi:hypothetical protein